MAKKKAAPRKQSKPAPVPEDQLGPEGTPAAAELTPVEFMGGLYALKLRGLVQDMDSLHIEDVKTRLLAFAQELDSIKG